MEAPETRLDRCSKDSLDGLSPTVPKWPFMVRTEGAVGERLVLTGRPPVGDKREEEAMVVSSDDWLVCLEDTGGRRVAATQSGKGAAGTTKRQGVKK